MALAFHYGHGMDGGIRVIPVLSSRSMIRRLSAMECWQRMMPPLSLCHTQRGLRQWKLRKGALKHGGFRGSPSVQCCRLATLHAASSAPAGTPSTTPDTSRPAGSASVTVNPSRSANAGHTFRVWNATENWCSLCLEPFNSWNEHRGKRDHICLEMFYNALVHCDRRWDPRSLWWEIEDGVLGHACRQASGRATDQLTPRIASGYARANLSTADTEEYVGVMYEDSNPLFTFLHCYDRGEPALRRQELLLCLRYLRDAGVLQVHQVGGASWLGSLVMFKEFYPSLAQLFPLAEAKEISALSQMISSTYNSETVYELCRLDSLATANDLHRRGGLQPMAFTSPAGMGTTAPSDDNDCEDSGASRGDGAEGGASYFMKGVFCRGILGQLRWALEPDSVTPPSALLLDEKRRGFYEVLAAHAARLLLGEMLFCKISEYVVRVEGVFRQRSGLEEAALVRHVHNSYLPPIRPISLDQRRRRKVAGGGGEHLEIPAAVDTLSPTARAASKAYFCGMPEVVPATSNWGMLQYMDQGRFFDDRFGGSANERAKGRLSRRSTLKTNGKH